MKKRKFEGLASEVFVNRMILLWSEINPVGMVLFKISF